jgi:hypothetical protein
VILKTSRCFRFGFLLLGLLVFLRRVRGGANQVAGKLEHLGLAATEEDAARKYDARAKSLGRYTDNSVYLPHRARFLLL